MANVMEYKGFKAQIMEAPRLTGDQVHGLPPGSPLEVYPSDVFMKLPESWMKGPGVFIVPVRPNKGLWFDWRDNSEINTAIIPTVKGCNPITGMQTSGFHLEKYETKCPKHGCNFLAERFCPECNYKWPDRNYISMSPSWWDGFRAEDGTVRQFFFSEDELRDIATALIGKENTVPAFGFAFYSPKERRSEPALIGDSIGSINNTGWYGSSTQVYCASFPALGHNGAAIINETTAPCMDSASVMFAALAKGEPSTPLEMKTYGSVKGLKSLAASQKQLRCRQVVKEVSIGAGAKIHQALNQDSYSLDSWKEAPDSVMTIYFVFQEKFEELKSDGMRDLSGVPEGMLKGLLVG